MRRRSRRLWWLPGWVFAAITQFPALLAVAWLVPGTGMLLAGRLLPLPLLIIFVPLALALCYFAMRQLPVSWPRFSNPMPGIVRTMNVVTRSSLSAIGSRKAPRLVC